MWSVWEIGAHDNNYYILFVINLISNTVLLIIISNTVLLIRFTSKYDKKNIVKKRIYMYSCYQKLYQKPYQNGLVVSESNIKIDKR